MESKKINWALTLIFCLIFGALGFIAGTMSDCGKSSKCEAPKQSCSTHHGESSKKSCSAHHGVESKKGCSAHKGDATKKGCSAHHSEESSEKKCCSADKKCEKHSKEVEIEVEEIISED